MFKFIENLLDHPRVVQFFTAIVPGSAELVTRPDVALNITNIMTEGKVSRDALLGRKFYKAKRNGKSEVNEVNPEVNPEPTSSTPEVPVSVVLGRVSMDLNADRVNRFGGHKAVHNALSDSEINSEDESMYGSSRIKRFKAGAPGTHPLASVDEDQPLNEASDTEGYTPARQNAGSDTAATEVPRNLDAADRRRLAIQAARRDAARLQEAPAPVAQPAAPSDLLTPSYFRPTVVVQPTAAQVKTAVKEVLAEKNNSDKGKKRNYRGG
jgi:hypothetical protein